MLKDRKDELEFETLPSPVQSYRHKVHSSCDNKLFLCNLRILNSYNFVKITFISSYAVFLHSSSYK